MNTSITQREPKLRFPDFQDDWEYKKVGELYKLISGQHLSPEEYNMNKNGIPYFTGPSDFTNDIVNLKKWTKKISHDAIKGDLLITVKGSGVGKMMLLEMPSVKMGRQLMAIRKENGHCIFLFQFLLKKNSYLKALAMGNMIPGLSRQDILKTKLLYPKDELETKKIANFLSTVDKKIQQLAEKQSLLQQYKKGIMQKLFSQEIRFKDEQGNDFPDWEEKIVGDFMKESRVKGSGGDKAKKITVKLWGKGVFEKNEKNSGSENTQYYRRKSGQFIYSKLDFLNCAFGVIPEYLDEFETTVDLPCFDVEQSISKYFVLEYIKQKKFYKKYGDMADGSRKAKRIHADTFLGFPINLPSTKEQNKITSFLGELDKKIDFTRQQIEQTQTFKKGLLQQMFV